MSVKTFTSFFRISLFIRTFVECMNWTENSILIADAGGTSTNWRLIFPPDTQSLSFRSGPLNAALLDPEDILMALQPVLDELQGIVPCEIRFFGAGCGTENICRDMQRILSDVFGTSAERVYVESDLYGAALSLLGDKPGIACILGTGSAASFWSGESIIDATPSLGYVLGDEGSGADMGKRLLNAYFKRLLPEEASHAFRSEYPDLGIGEVIENVYHRKEANKWLASFTRFVSKNASKTGINEIIEDSFRDFYRKNVARLVLSTPSPVIAFTGSVSYVFRRQLARVMNVFGLEVTKIQSSPIEGLAEYYQKQINKK